MTPSQTFELPAGETFSVMRVVPGAGHSATFQLFDYDAAETLPVRGERFYSRQRFADAVTATFTLDRPRLEQLGIKCLRLAGHGKLAICVMKWLEEHEERRSYFTYAGELESNSDE